MSFYVACQCGRAFEVADDHPGGSARCPECGRDVPVVASNAGDGTTPEPVETVDAERAGDEPAPIGGAGPDPGFGPQPPFGQPRQVNLQSSGTGCLLVAALIVIISIAVPRVGAAVAGGFFGCCALPALVVGIMFWWRLRQLKHMTDPNRRGGGGPAA